MGGTSIETPAGISAEERMQFLEKEQSLADEREEKQRDFMLQQENMRQAQEAASRKLIEQEEASRIAELERMEREGADVAEGLAESGEVDTSVADMYSALASGTEFISEDEDETPPV
jgi:hypothetical protein